MTLGQALTEIEELKPSQLGRPMLTKWLSQLDMKVFQGIIEKHIPGPDTPREFAGYTEETDEDTVLLVPDPESEIYRWYLEMQIDYANMEMQKYNNSAALFNEAYDSYARKYRREHMPKQNATYFKF